MSASNQNLKLLDVHTHLSFKPETTATVEGLIASMDAAGIYRSLVFAASIFDCPTHKVVEAAKLHPDRLFPIASITSEASAELHNLQVNDLEYYLKNNLVYGLKLYTGYEHCFANDPIWHRYIELCAKYQKPVIFHTGDTFCKHRKAKVRYAHPIYVDDVATDFPNVNFIISHFGYPWHRDAAEVVYKNPNVYVDGSGFVYGKFDREWDWNRFKKVIEEFVEVADGTDRILFGSDWPISDQASYLNFMSRAMGKMIGVDETTNALAHKIFGIPMEPEEIR